MTGGGDLRQFSILRRARKSSYLMLAGLIVLLAGLTLVIIGIIGSLNSFRQTPRDNLQWAVYQLAHELQRLELTAERWRADDPAGTEELRKRFDILYSRVELLQEPLFGEIRAGDEVTVASAEVGTFMAAVDALLSGRSPLTQVEVSGLHAQIDAFFPVVDQLSIDTLHAVAKLTDDRRARLEETIKLAVIVFSSLLVLLGGALALLMLQRRRLRRQADDLRKTADRLAGAQQVADAANTAKSEFLAVMSHELRTPMNGVLGMLSSLEDTRLRPDQKTLVTIARASADSLLVILNDILDMSKIEAGKLELESTRFELLPLLRSIVHLYAHQARAKGISLDSLIIDPIPQWFEGDAGRLRQVVSNFVSNAVKFTAVGTVTIRATIVSPPTEPKLRLRVEVADTGPGIPVDRHADVFSKFNQLDRSYARRFGGTGLGLAISKSLAELMGGTIGFTSAAGQGATFWIEIPIERAVGDPPVAVADTRTMQPMKILVAEDNATNQLVARQILERMGHRVDVVDNGVEAVEAVASRPYDVVLMDISMPLMDGVEATTRIRALGGRLAEIPIIALTANAMSDDIASYLDAGMTGFVSKPVVKDKLAAALASSMGLRPVDAPYPDPLEARGVAAQVDSARLVQLAGDVGPEVMPKLLATYVADLTRAAGDMRAAITSTDARAAGRAVHSIKSVAINLGAVELAELADRAERRSKTSVGIDIETVNEITQVTNLLVEEVLDLSSQFVK